MPNSYRTMILAIALFAAVCRGLEPGASPPPSSYHQAPELQRQVLAHTLPPVKKRLPQTPMIIPPHDEIGTYGGVWRRAHLGPKDVGAANYLMQETLVVYSPDYRHTVPNICRSYEISADRKTLTFHLRPGMKWSDGHPFGADDFMFWYETFQDKRLTPVIPLWVQRAGVPLVMRKLDDLTIQICFVKPYGAFLDYMAGFWGPRFYLPAHYAKRFHPDYVSPETLEKEMHRGSFNHWVDMFRRKTTFYHNPECPTINAWMVKDRASAPIQRWVRNPYYWKIDPKGNQLPYIDEIHYHLVSDAEAILLQAMAGEIDLQMRRIGGINVVGIENYPLLMEHREQGQYHIVCRNMFRQIKYSILFNFTHEDPELRRLFNDRRFRVALSLGMDRQELIDFCLQGLGEPSQVVPNPASQWFEKDVMKLYTQHDPKEANRLLDDIGLRWDRKHRYRLRSDGKPLMLTIKSISSTVEGMELIREQWRDIGLKIVVTPVEASYWYTMLRAGNYDLTTTGVNAAWDGCFKHSVIVPPYHCDYPAPKWGLWARTAGQAGEEPPPWMKDMLALVDPILSKVRGPQRAALIKKMTRMFVESQMEIGGVMVPPQSLYAVVKNHMRNVPDPLPNFMCCHPASFYIRPEKTTTP